MSASGNASLNTTTSKKAKKLVNVVLLTGEEHQIYVDVKAKLQEVFNQVASTHGLRETEYFGLAELKDGEFQFLNLEDKIHKHAPKAWKSSSGEGLDKHGKPMLSVHFRVQLFVDQVILLREKVTRYLYYLQLKENVLKYQYLCSEERCYQLAALSLQADLGNYTPHKHDDDIYFDPREYFPAWVVEKRGHEYLCKNVPTMHRDLRHTTKSDAQLKFIREASLSPAAHNLHFYRLKKRKTDKTWNAWLGICPRGIEIYEDSADGFKDLISTFFWPDIGKLHFEKKKFEIRSVGIWDGRKFTYYTDSDAKSKFLLSLCRSTHMFQMAVQPKLLEIHHLDAEDKRRYRESYIYSDARDMVTNRAASPSRGIISPKKTGGTGQRYSVVSNTSSNTTSGIVSDKLHISFDESEEFDDDGSHEIMIDSPPRSLPNMGTTILTTPKQGRTRLIPFCPKLRGIDRRTKEVPKSPATRSSSNHSQTSGGSGHPELSPITSNGSYRSRLQQHQQMLYGAHLQQLASTTQPFTQQNIQPVQHPSPKVLTTPKSRHQSPSVSRGQSRSLTGPHSPREGTPVIRAKSQLRHFESDYVSKPGLGPSTPQTPLRSRYIVSTPQPQPQQQQPLPSHQPDSELTALTPDPPQPVSVNSSVPGTVQQPYTAQQIQVKQPQQFLAQQVSASQPKPQQQYYVQGEKSGLAPTATKPPIHPGPPQQHQQQFAVPLPQSQPQYALEQTLAQQQFAVPLSQAQKPLLQQSLVVQPMSHLTMTGLQTSQPHQPMPNWVLQQQQQPNMLTGQQQPQQMVQPQHDFHMVQPPQLFSALQNIQSQQQYLAQQPLPVFGLPQQQQQQQQHTAASMSLQQHAVEPPPPYGSAVVQYVVSEPLKKTSRPASRTPSRVDSFKKNLGQLQLHPESSNGSFEQEELSLPLSHTASVCSSSMIDSPVSRFSLSPAIDQGERTPESPHYMNVQAIGSAQASIDGIDAEAEIDKAYCPLFDPYDENYFIPEALDVDTFAEGNTTDIQEASIVTAQSQLVDEYQSANATITNPAPAYIAVQPDTAEKAVGNNDEALKQEPAMEGEGAKAKKTRAAKKTKKEKLLPELEEIRGNENQFTLPLMMALVNDSSLVPSGSGHSSDFTYDTSTICSTDSHWSCDTDSRRLSSSYPSSTGTMISLYSATRPFSWHSENFDRDAQIAASMRRSSRGVPPLADSHRSVPQGLYEIPSSYSANPHVASWTQAISYGMLYGPPVDRYSPELLATQHMIPPKISSGGHTKAESNIKTLKENVGIA